MNADTFTADPVKTAQLLKDIKFVNVTDLSHLTKEQLVSGYIAHQYVLAQIIQIIDRLSFETQIKDEIGKALIDSDFIKLHATLCGFVDLLNDQNYHLLHHFMNFILSFALMFPADMDQLNGIVEFMEKFKVTVRKQEEDKRDAIKQAEEIFKNRPKK